MVALVTGELVDDSVHGGRGAAGVECSEDKVAGLGGFERDARGLEISELADEDDIGVFAERGAERGREALGVAADLTLVDEGSLVLVDVLDRVLNGDDVDGSLAIDEVDERREGGGLAASGGPGDEDEAGAELAERSELLGESEVVVVGDGGGDAACDEPDAAPVSERVDAKPGRSALVGEVCVVVGLERRPNPGLGDRLEHRFDRLRVQGGCAGEGREDAVDAHPGCRAGANMDVARYCSDHRVQDRVRALGVHM